MGLRFCHRCRACSPAVRSSLAGIRRIAHTHVAWQVSPTGQLVIGVAGCTHTAAHFGVSRCASTYNMPCTCSRWAFAGCRQCLKFPYSDTEKRANAMRIGSSIMVRIAADTWLSGFAQIMPRTPSRGSSCPTPDMHRPVRGKVVVGLTFTRLMGRKSCVVVLVVGISWCILL